MAGATQASDERAVREVLERLQAAYTARDVDGLDAFMELFVEGGEPEMIGTEAAERGDFDWGHGRAGVRAITEWDWRHWFDVRFRLDQARITVRGDVAWVTVPVTLVQTELSREGARRFIEESVLPDLRRVLDDEYLAPGARLGEAAARATARLRELAAPPGDRRPLTYSAVLVRDGGVWRFHTTHWALAAL
jgi:ketosteroid isomerase-like protein